MADSDGSTAALKRFGTIILSPGVTPGQVCVFLLITCACTFVNEFFLVMQPLVYTQQLHIDPAKQGFLAGMLGTTQQWGTFICIAFAGSLADIFGRRVMLVFTLTGFWLCLMAYPFAAAVWALFALRFFWGISFTGFTAGTATIAMDFPDNRSRGKFISLVLVVPMMVSAVLVFGATRLTSGIRDMGYGPHAALLGSFGIVSLAALLGAAAAFFYFVENKRILTQQRAPTVGAQVKAVFANIGGVFAHARHNRRFALILLIGSVVRTDSVILASFLGLWVVSAGHLVGIDAVAATKTAGLLASVRLMTMVGGLVVFGLIADRTNRVRLVLIALAMTTLGFAAFGLISDVFGIGMIAVVVLIGIAEGAQSISSQSLIAQEAPAHLRGSSMGVFAFLGTASLMAVNLLGGFLFDKMGYASPMLMEAVLHLVVLIACIIVLRISTPGAPATVLTSDDLRHSSLSH